MTAIALIETRLNVKKTKNHLWEFVTMDGWECTWDLVGKSEGKRQLIRQRPRGLIIKNRP